MTNFYNLKSNNQTLQECQKIQINPIDSFGNWYYFPNLECNRSIKLHQSSYRSEQMLEALPELQRELIENRPSWATGASAIAVFSGLFASFLLLLKKAFPHFI